MLGTVVDPWARELDSEPTAESRRNKKRQIIGSNGECPVQEATEVWVGGQKRMGFLFREQGKASGGVKSTSISPPHCETPAPPKPCSYCLCANALCVCGYMDPVPLG